MVVTKRLHLTKNPLLAVAVESHHLNFNQNRLKRGEGRGMVPVFLTSQLLIQGPPRSHGQGLDELGELDASILRREMERIKISQRDKRLRTISHSFHDVLAALCPKKKNGARHLLQVRGYFCPAPGSLLRQRYVTSGHY